MTHKPLFECKTSKQIFDLIEPLLCTLSDDIKTTFQNELTSNGINGESLIFFNNSHFNEMCIKHIDHQNIIMKAIDSLYNPKILSQYISKFPQFQSSTIPQLILDAKISLQSLKNEGHKISFYKNTLKVQNDDIINEFIETFAMIFNYNTNDYQPQNIQKFALSSTITNKPYFQIFECKTSEQVFNFLEPLISTLHNDILNTLRSELTLHGINGESLIFFNNSHLNELHITNIDHQNIIMKAINSLYDSIVLSQYISKFSQFQYSMISQSIMDTEINLESLKNQGHQQSFYKNILNIRNDNIINEFIQTFAMIFNHKTNDNNHKKNCSNTHELSTLPFSALIVAGYIHDIEVLLKNRLITVMPDDIIFLCYQFYKHCTRLAITYKNNIHFGIMDIQSKYISHIQPFNSSPMSHKVLLNISYAARLSCYIPNITFNTEFERLTHNGSNDAIFGAFVGKSKYGSGRKDSKEYVYPCFSLFSSHNYETDDVYYHIISKRKMCGFKRALYCKERNSIFGEFEGILYELKLANVTDLNFRFKKLYSKQPQIWNHHRMWKYSQKYLVMEYMNDMDRIFGISCHSSRQMRRPRRGNGQIKCGLYDFKLNRWNDICSFKYESNPSIGNVFSCKTCYDRKQNFIYMKSNIGHTARYDGNENKWQIFINTKFGRNCRKEQLDNLWIDKQNANILYCAHIEDESIDRSDNGYAHNKKIVFKQLDLRMHCMEWMKIDECSIKQARKQGCNVSIMTGD